MRPLLSRPRFWLSVPVVVLVGCVVWSFGRLGPKVAWWYVEGRPLTFSEAAFELDLGAVQAVPGAPEPSVSRLSERTIAAGVTISMDTLRLYDVGPELGRGGDVLYPRAGLQVELDDGRIPEEHLRGQFFGQLHAYLLERRKTLKTLIDTDDADRLVIAADQSVPFSTLRSIMYSAGQAGYSDMQFVLWQGSERVLVDPALPAISPADLPPRQAAVGQAIQGLEDVPGGWTDGG